MRRGESNLPVRAEAADDVPQLNPLDVFRLRTTAWLVRRAAEAELTILEARRRVAEARVETEDAEGELHLRRTIRAAGPEQGRRILGQETEVERLLAERSRLRGQRLGGGLADAHPALPASAGALDVAVTDRQIEALALKAVSRFGNLPPEQAERAWSAWRRELGLRLPTYAAQEVARRAEELRRLLR